MYRNLIVETLEGRVGLVRINRPERRNALNNETVAELAAAVSSFDGDEGVGSIVVTGDETAFAAGADITEMQGKAAAEMLLAERFEQLERLRRTHKPLVAAVSGYALGGGLELAMLCDLIIASDTATFGQPEINLGIMPGAGGTQRLTRQLGKALAMEMVLNARFLKAGEAHARGLVNDVHPVGSYLEEAITLAREIAARAPVALRLAKQAVLRAQETTLEHGLELERHNYYLCFATQDKEEGVQAFLEKREPRWQGK